MEEQLKCIIYNLKKCKIKHLDMHPNGKNLCINERGIISVIDFDAAVINNNYKSKKIKDSANKYKNNNHYYNNLKKKIISIINNVMKKKK